LRQGDPEAPHEDRSRVPPAAGTRPLIVTIEIDEPSFEFFDAQRRAHFPPERNFIPAHITLFHHLPGDHAPAIRAELARVSRREAFRMDVTGLRSLGRGVAYTVESPTADELRAGLAETWAGWLTPQDRQKPRLHVTVQNKVAPETARRLIERLAAGFTPFRVTAQGLRLWSYDGGPWTLLERFPFEI
jgi:hypothetical protein